MKNYDKPRQHIKKQRLEKTLMLGKIEGGRRGWQRMRWLDGITDLMGMRFEQVPGVGEGKGSLVCCSPQGHKELDTTEWLNWTELNVYIWNPNKNLVNLPGWWTDPCAGRMTCSESTERGHRCSAVGILPDFTLCFSSVCWSWSIFFIIKL